MKNRLTKIILPLLLFLFSCAERKQERISNLIQYGEYTTLENYEDGTVPDAAVHPEKYDWRSVHGSRDFKDINRLNLIRIRIPKNAFQHPVLYFNRTDSANVVFADNKIIYRHSEIRQFDPFSFSGFLWHIVEIPDSENTVLYVLFRSYFGIEIESVIADKSEILQYMYDLAIPGLIVVSTSLLLGLAFLTTSFVQKLDRFYLYLSLFCLGISGWLFTINHLSQLYIRMDSVKFIFEVFCLYTGVIFNLLFLSIVFGSALNRLLILLIKVFVILGFFSFSAHFLHIFPLMKSLIAFNILSCIALIVYIVNSFIFLRRGNAEGKILISGLFCLAVFSGRDTLVVLNIFASNDKMLIFWGVLGVILSLSGIAVYRVVKMHLELQEKNETQRKLIKSYARFVPEQLLYFLGKNIVTDINLGDAVEKEMAILFSDIRSFTALSENMTPDENFGFINSYMAVMGPCIRKNNGFIDKYIGDAIMALFPEKPSDAIDAAIDMLDELYSLNVKRKEKGFMPISIGIGIHIGTQMLGIIGEKERLEGTVISDAVNTASRLESLTKSYSSSVLISMDL